MKKRLHKIIALSLAAALIMTNATACARKKKATEKSTTANVSEKASDYNIGIALKYENDDYVLDYNAMLLGFKAAIKDNAGKHTISYEVNKDPEKDNMDSVISGYLNDKDLIFTLGPEALKAAVKDTTDIPVVSCGVIDFYDALGLRSADRYIWSRKTGTNITGVSSLPALAEHLSALIELTDNAPENIGLFYEKGNMEEIYQNTLLEKYLDEAGIKWTEFGVSLNPETPDDSVSAVTERALATCSILYLPAGEGLKPYAEEITSLASAAGKFTFGGDENIGTLTSISSFEDPYDKGYKAGEMAYQILFKNEEPGTMRVGLSNGTISKLYNKTIIGSMGVTLPKSFNEYDEFFKKYSPGE